MRLVKLRIESASCVCQDVVERRTTVTAVVAIGDLLQFAFLQSHRSERDRATLIQPLFICNQLRASGVFICNQRPSFPSSESEFLLNLDTLRSTAVVLVGKVPKFRYLLILHLLKTYCTFEQDQ